MQMKISNSDTISVALSTNGTMMHYAVEMLSLQCEIIPAYRDTPNVSN